MGSIQPGRAMPLPHRVAFQGTQIAGPQPERQASVHTTGQTTGPLQQGSLKTAYIMAVAAFSGILGGLVGNMTAQQPAPLPPQTVQANNRPHTNTHPASPVRTNGVWQFISENPPPPAEKDPLDPDEVPPPADDGGLTEAPPPPTEDDEFPKPRPKIKNSEELAKERQTLLEQAEKERLQQEEQRYQEELKRMLTANTQLEPQALSETAMAQRSQIGQALKAGKFENTTNRNDLYQKLVDYSFPATVHVVSEFDVTLRKGMFNLFTGTPSKGERAYPQSGTGFFIKEDGLFVTNHHVINLKYRDENGHTNHRLADRVNVTLYDGRQVKATRVAADEKLDLAVYKLDGTFHNLPILELAKESHAGEEVMAVGHPIGQQWSASFGKISNHHRIYENKVYLQTDALINHGNSGGPLINNRGELVGVNDMIITMSDGAPLGISIRFDTLNDYLKTLLPPAP